MIKCTHVHASIMLSCGIPFGWVQETEFREYLCDYQLRQLVLFILFLLFFFLFLLLLLLVSFNLLLAKLPCFCPEPIWYEREIQDPIEFSGKKTDESRDETWSKLSKEDDDNNDEDNPSLTRTTLHWRGQLLLRDAFDANIHRITPLTIQSGAFHFDLLSSCGGLCGSPFSEFVHLDGFL